MKRLNVVLVLLLAACSLPRSAYGLPLLESPVPLPASFDGVITIYPDSANTKEIRRYWLVPSTARIVRSSQSNLLEFGMVHSGLTLTPNGKLDPDGVRGLLTLTVQPYVDPKTMADAKRLIDETARKEGATSVTFSFVTPREMKGWLMVGGHPSDFWGSGGALAAAGGTIEAGYVFQISLKEGFDVRALTQAGGDAASTLGVRFSLRFTGMTNPCRFSVTAQFKELYEHFKASVSASGWFGLARASAATEWQKLKGAAFVKFKNDGCNEQTIEKYHAMKLIDNLLTQLAQKTGQFAPAIRPKGLPNAPGGGGIFGWSFNASAGYEKVDEDREITYAVDIQTQVDDEITFGMSFPTAATELRPHLKNLTDSSKPLPTAADIEQVANANRHCVRDRIAWLRELYDLGAISKEFLQQEVQASVKKGCAAGMPPHTDALKALLFIPPQTMPAYAVWDGALHAARIARNEALIAAFVTDRE
ncbi:MAG TPA: hypothetical protein VM364_03705 [Vicinamibacterales bacterium]|nr:hypothetical protein [Vicinamibacterales bacterium]